ncbi:MAG: uroporphyrinogen-III C-methyltransferase [Dehalococcoidia bacterium]|nr:uroporphyrinogen-III C-methyltransferase [Dehalococcoidia bacterium]MSQ17118.1 uroporphyrinogen-III C-methyltransferase [Dehalococcoidia bacterium]
MLGKGKVYLVGAGPGDPGLITVKGLRVLSQAQVVVYDRLLDPSLLQHAAPDAEQVFVGKARGRQALTQEQINQLLVDRASAGQTVVRLKGGDPFVFGRGGEEALALAQHGIPFEVVPGVTSAIAAAAYAGIPITHRRVATCFTVVSGSEDPAKPESSIPWDVLARTGGTLVVLMGWNALESILRTLGSQGMAADTPVALVQWGTWPQQRTVTGVLADVAARGRQAGLEPPVLAVIGPVVKLREQLRWFGPDSNTAGRPLWGKRVLITRSRTQASRLRALLEAQGALPLELPAIEIAPLEDCRKLDAALARLNHFGWVIFASGNAVDSVFARLEGLGKDARAFGGTQVGAIGPATAEALARRGIRADFIPARSASEAVVDELSKRPWAGVPVLLPAADIGRDVLAQGLARLGAQVEWVAAYRTVTPAGAGGQARQMLDQGVDVVTFASSSTVRNLLELLGGDKAALEGSLIACIGPATAATARELGLPVGLVSDEHNVEGLVDALVRHFGDAEIPPTHLYERGARQGLP